MKNKAPITLAITGASGAQYALRLLQALVAEGHPIYLLISKAAQMVIAVETDLAMPSHHGKAAAFLEERYQAYPGQIRLFGKEDWMSPVASGSGAPKHMVVCPCSTGTLSAIATGASDNLIERAADVVLKERRPLVLMVRETPLHLGHLRTMTALAEMGAVIAPPLPAFYSKPASIAEMVDQSVGRALDLFGLDWSAVRRWGGLKGPSTE